MTEKKDTYCGREFTGDSVWNGENIKATYLCGQPWKDNSIKVCPECQERNSRMDIDIKVDVKPVTTPHIVLSVEKAIEKNAEHINHNQYDEDAIRKCYRFFAHEKETEIRIIHPQKAEYPQSIFVHSEDEFVKVCKEYNGRFNIYAGINERLPNGTDKVDVRSVKTIVLDLDAVRAEGFQKEPATESELKEAEKDCDAIIESMTRAGALQPTKVNSGNGWQIWIAIPEIEIDETNRIEVEDKLKMFQTLIQQRYEKYSSIDNIGDLPRIMKVWGTLNIKSQSKQETPERKYRISRVVQGGIRNEDQRLKNQIMEIKIEEDKYLGVVTHIDDLDVNFLPKPIKYLLHEYKHTKPENWMRIVETLASFFRGIGLEEDKSIAHLVEWSKRQPYRENGEEKEIAEITKRIFKNKINCPNFDKLVFKSEGYPYFGLRSVFQGVDLGEKEWKSFVNPIKYYKVKEERSKLNEFEKVSKDASDCLMKRDPKSLREATELVVTYIEKNYHILCIAEDKSPEVWIYKAEKGIYEQNGESALKALIRQIVKDNYTTSFAKEVIEKIKADKQISLEDFVNRNYDYIDEVPVLNGILNTSTKELYDFTPNKIFFSRLPVKYDATAECPAIEKHFKEVLADPKDLPIIYEVFGFGLKRMYFIEKAIILVGDGRNGKGKTLEIARRLFGAENCSNIPLKEIRQDSFELSDMFGKLMNISGDLSADEMKDTSTFKMATGRDTIMAKRKFRSPIKFINYAKHLYACNELPRVYDTSRGFWSRWVLLNFPYIFVTQEDFDKATDKSKFKIMDPNHVEKITTPEELSGLLNRALEGLERLKLNKDFSYTKGSAEIKELWMRKADSFLAFCMDVLETNTEKKVSKSQLRKLYQMYCKHFGVKAVSDKSIKITLENEFGVSEERIWDPMKQQQIFFWDGIAFKPEFLEKGHEMDGLVRLEGVFQKVLASIGSLGTFPNTPASLTKNAIQCPKCQSFKVIKFSDQTFCEDCKHKWTSL